MVIHWCTTQQLISVSETRNENTHCIVYKIYKPVFIYMAINKLIPRAFTMCNNWIYIIVKFFEENAQFYILLTYISCCSTTVSRMRDTMLWAYTTTNMHLNYSIILGDCWGNVLHKNWISVRVCEQQRVIRRFRISNGLLWAKEMR